MLNYSIKYAYWIIFRNKVTDTVRKKEIIVLIVRFIYYLCHVSRGYGVILFLHFKYNKTS